MVYIGKNPSNGTQPLNKNNSSGNSNNKQWLLVEPALCLLGLTPANYFTRVLRPPHKSSARQAFPASAAGAETKAQSKQLRIMSMHT